MQARVEARCARGSSRGRVRRSLRWRSTSRVRSLLRAGAWRERREALLWSRGAWRCGGSRGAGVRCARCSLWWCAGIRRVRCAGRSLLREHARRRGAVTWLTMRRVLVRCGVRRVSVGAGRWRLLLLRLLPEVVVLMIPWARHCRRRSRRRRGQRRLRDVSGQLRAAAGGELTEVSGGASEY